MSTASARKMDHKAPKRLQQPLPLQFYSDVINGLKATQKKLMPKYFYDEAGSKFFDEICNLEEYYPYRTELNLLEIVAKDLGNHFDSPIAVVEFGAGSLKKIQPLITHNPQIQHFIPIDISGDHLANAANTLRDAFPDIKISPIEADFTHEVNLPESDIQYVGFFPGSTIGNFTPEEALAFLQNARKTLGHNSHLLIGVDTKKSPELLHNAYNDTLGVTAKFNLNILHRINRELNATINTDHFEHYAHYNPQQGCVQMFLVSTAPQQCTIEDEPIEFKIGESIHTENSYKYSPDEFSNLAALAGWTTQKTWLADNQMFSTFLLHNPNK